MKSIGLFPLVLIPCLVLASAASDAEAKRKIEMSMRETDNPRLPGLFLNAALELCDNETNRFTRLLQEVATENTNIADAVVSEIGRFGNASNLPFLYAGVTNRVVGRESVLAIFRIEGVTTNSVDRLNQFLSTSEMDLEDRMFCGCWVLESGLMSRAPQATQRYLLDCLIRLEDDAKRHVRGMDEVVIQFDPIFRYSRRRLTILRAANEISDISDYQRAYVTNAINELIAYPEANLND